MGTDVAVAGSRSPAAATDGEPTEDLVLRARGLVRRFGADIGVLGVDLSVGRRGVLALVGPNGAGKTTLLSLLCGLSTPDDGELQVTGRVAIGPDTPDFEPWLTAREVLRQSHALARPRTPLDTVWLDQVMTDTGVAPFADRRCGGFSRGMTQRLGIAAALVVDPDVLILDEPTSALDVSGRADVLALISELGTQRAVILSSHALADVQRTATTIAVMDAGRLLFTGPPRRLVHEYLRPTWRVTLAEYAHPVAATLSAQSWVRSVRARSSMEFDIEAHDLALGESRLVPALASLGVRVVAITPVDADLESAFLALTGHSGRGTRT